MLRRPQFTLKAVLIVMALLAVGCALFKYETDAKQRFAVIDAALTNAMQRVQQEADDELYQRWLRDPKSNTHVSGDVLWPLRSVVNNAGSGELTIFGSEHDWHILRTLPSHLPTTPDDERIDVEVICSRPWSVISQQTSIHIIERPAPDNSLFTDRLRTELEKVGIQIDTVTNAPAED